MAKKGAEEEAIDLSGKPRDAFDKERFMEAWNAYAEVVKQEGKSSFYSTMTKREPELISSEVVELLIDNELQEKELTSEKQDLMNFLRERLNNYHFDIQPRVAEAPEEKKRLLPQRHAVILLAVIIF